MDKKGALCGILVEMGLWQPTYGPTIVMKLHRTNTHTHTCAHTKAGTGKLGKSGRLIDLCQYLGVILCYRPWDLSVVLLTIATVVSIKTTILYFWKKK